MEVPNWCCVGIRIQGPPVWPFISSQEVLPKVHLKAYRGDQVDRVILMPEGPDDETCRVESLSIGYI